MNRTRERIGATVSIVVSSARKTTSGRLVFAEMKASPRLANPDSTPEPKIGKA